MLSFLIEVALANVKTDSAPNQVECEEFFDDLAIQSEIDFFSNQYPESFHAIPFNEEMKEFNYPLLRKSQAYYRALGEKLTAIMPTKNQAFAAYESEVQAMLRSQDKIFLPNPKAEYIEHINQFVRHLYKTLEQIKKTTKPDIVLLLNQIKNNDMLVKCLKFCTAANELGDADKISTQYAGKAGNSALEILSYKTSEQKLWVIFKDLEAHLPNTPEIQQLKFYLDHIRVNFLYLELLNVARIILAPAVHLDENYTAVYNVRPNKRYEKAKEIYNKILELKPGNYAEHFAKFHLIRLALAVYFENYEREPHLNPQKNHKAHQDASYNAADIALPYLDKIEDKKNIKDSHIDRVGLFASSLSALEDIIEQVEKETNEQQVGWQCLDVLIAARAQQLNIADKSGIAFNQSVHSKTRFLGYLITCVLRFEKYLWFVKKQADPLHKKYADIMAANIKSSKIALQQEDTPVGSPEKLSIFNILTWPLQEEEMMNQLANKCPDVMEDIFREAGKLLHSYGAQPAINPQGKPILANFGNGASAQPAANQPANAKALGANQLKVF